MGKGPEARGSKESKKGKEAVPCKSQEKGAVQLQEHAGHRLWDPQGKRREESLILSRRHWLVLTSNPPLQLPCG